jgi:hypothetical protein
MEEAHNLVGLAPLDPPFLAVFVASRIVTSDPMSNKHHRRARDEAEFAGLKGRRLPVLVAVLVIAGVGIGVGVLSWTRQPSEKPSPAAPAEETTRPSAPAPDTSLQSPSGGAPQAGGDGQKFVGTWARTDGEYVLAVTGVKPDGQMKAAYYNPRPINVGQSEIRGSGPATELFVLLRDAGYPGIPRYAEA